MKVIRKTVGRARRAGELRIEPPLPATFGDRRRGAHQRALDRSRIRCASASRASHRADSPFAITHPAAFPGATVRFSLRGDDGDLEGHLGLVDHEAARVRPPDLGSRGSDEVQSEVVVARLLDHRVLAGPDHVAGREPLGDQHEPRLGIANANLGLLDEIDFSVGVEGPNAERAVLGRRGRRGCRGRRARGGRRVGRDVGGLRGGCHLELDDLALRERTHLLRGPIARHVGGHGHPLEHRQLVAGRIALRPHGGDVSARRVALHADGHRF